MSENNKCKVDQGLFLRPCDALTNVCEYGNPTKKAKGVFLWRYVTPQAGVTRIFAGAKSGEHVTNGIAFNYCPFCGEKVDAPFCERSEVNHD